MPAQRPGMAQIASLEQLGAPVLTNALGLARGGRHPRQRSSSMAPNVPGTGESAAALCAAICVAGINEEALTPVPGVG